MAANGVVLNVTGVDTVTVNDGPVNAKIGGDLAGFTADIEFDVSDTADAIAIEVANSGYGAGGLDEANNIAVVSGDVTALEADAIQDIAKYSGADSDYDITDNAAALISAKDDVLNVTGVDIVTVNDGPVNASDGAILNGFAADVEYTVADSAANIVANSDNLTEADHIQVVDNVANSADITQAEIIEQTGHSLTTY